MTTLLLFGLLWLFSFVLTCSHFSDQTSSLTKVFHRQKAGRGCGEGGSIIGSCSVSESHSRSLEFSTVCGRSHFSVLPCGFSRKHPLACGSITSPSSPGHLLPVCLSVSAPFLSLPQSHWTEPTLLW